MFNFFKRKKKKPSEPKIDPPPSQQPKSRSAPPEGAAYAGIRYHDFLVRLPRSWDYGFDGGKLRAKCNEEIRLTITPWDVSTVPDFSVEGTLDMQRQGYGSAGYTPYDEPVKGKDYIRQTMQMDGNPCMILAALEKNVGSTKIALALVFGADSSEVLEKHKKDIDVIISDLPVLADLMK